MLFSTAGQGWVFLGMVAAGALMGYLAVLMAAGMVTGALTGLLAKAVNARLKGLGI